MHKISFNRFVTSNSVPISLTILTYLHSHSEFDCLLAVPPAYYAHLAAFRARYYIEGDTSDAGSSTGGKGISASFEVKLPSVKGNVADVMFFC